MTDPDPAAVLCADPPTEDHDKADDPDDRYINDVWYPEEQQLPYSDPSQGEST